MTPDGSAGRAVRFAPREAAVPGVTGTGTPSPACPPSISATPTARPEWSALGREQDVDVRRHHRLHAVDAGEVREVLHLRVLAANANTAKKASTTIA